MPNEDFHTTPPADLDRGQELERVDLLGPDADALDIADRWWTLVVRGGAALLFGIVALVSPGAGLLALVAIFGAYALVDGVFNLAAVASGAARKWGWLLVEALLSLFTGGLAFFWPGVTALALVMLIAIWSVTTGIAEIAVGIRLRDQIKDEWLLILSGVLSLAFGLALALFPAVGAFVVTLWIAAYALVFGGLLVALGLKLRSWGRGYHEKALSSP
jgi:uncharacterized membrane protein HdeD (DUF308 family)